MTWILQNRGWIFAVILLMVPLIITGWFYGTKKNKEGEKREGNAGDMHVGGN